jgi:hypothetical protein
MVPGKYLLSNLLKTRFPGGGVFIISSCRAIPGNTVERFRIQQFKGAPARGTAWTDPITRSNQFKPTIRRRPMRRQKLNLMPRRPVTSFENKYPPETIRKLREAVTIGGKNLWSALLDPTIKARANIWSREPSEVASLLRQVRLRNKKKTSLRKIKPKITK